MGKVDEWRFFRRGFILTVKPYMKQGDISAVLKNWPLPFDEAIEETSEFTMEDYQRALSVTNEWLKNK